MKNIKWLRSIAFLMLLVLAVSGVMHCYGLPKDHITRNIAAFDEEKEKTIDGVVLGTSVVAYAWVTPAAWQDYGLSIYQYSSNAQPFGAMNEYLDHIRETQDIKFAVIDVHGIRSAAVKTSIRPGVYRYAYLNVPDIKHRYKILDALFDYAAKAYEAYDISEEEQAEYIKLYDISYYIPFLNFHGRWLDGLKKSDFVTVANKFKGANDRKNTFDVYDCSSYIDRWDYELPEDINDFQKEQLQRVFDYGKENNIELLFINLPSFRTKEEQQEMGALIEYCRKQGYDTIDFTDEAVLKESQVDISKDFCNKGHLNSNGGIKVTKYLCQYLIDNGYYTPDHRGEKGYESWDTVSDAYWSFYNKGWNKKG